MSSLKHYVEEDAQYALRVGSLGVSLDSVVIAHEQGHSAETILQHYPALNLEEVYGAIAYYLANRDVVNQYLERQDELWDQGRKSTVENPNPVVRPRCRVGFAPTEYQRLLYGATVWCPRNLVGTRCSPEPPRSLPPVSVR